MRSSREYWSVSALARELRMDKRTLAKRLEGLEPARERKYANRTEREYALGDVHQHLITQPGVRSQDEASPERAERLRVISARADLLEIEAAIKRGEVAPVEDFAEALSQILAEVAQSLNRLPGLAHEFAEASQPALVRRRLREIVAEIRNDAAARIDRLASGWQRGHR